MPGLLDQNEHKYRSGRFLNQAGNLETCITKAMLAQWEDGLDRGVVVAKNGSSDVSQAMARHPGERAAFAQDRVYSIALIGRIVAVPGPSHHRMCIQLPSGQQEIRGSQKSIRSVASVTDMSSYLTDKGGGLIPLIIELQRGLIPPGQGLRRKDREGRPDASKERVSSPTGWSWGAHFIFRNPRFRHQRQSGMGSQYRF